jgi:D-alanyl-D-alanine carboxypeptidase
MAFGDLRIGLYRLAPLAAGVCLAACALTMFSGEAQARRHHYRWRGAQAPSGSAPAEVDGSKFSAMVVDANTGREIWGVNENALRHPASITKVMTLYLLFEQLEKGTMTLETRIPVSEHAANQEPSKLGVPAGETISVEEAIKAIVTRSANDMAVAVAEAVGHDESNFSAMMTHAAHQIGMSRTLYRNASGLPNDEQLTTAHDLTLLGRSLQERFPKYYHYFSLHEFTYDGEVIGNHDHLLGRVDGVDGIKTGYTRASGFNLLTSVHRDGRALVAVVMGGRSAPARDRLMARIIEDHIAEASPAPSATRLAEATPEAAEPAPVPEPPRLGPNVERVSLAEAETDRHGFEPQGDGDDNDDDRADRPVRSAPIPHAAAPPTWAGHLEAPIKTAKAEPSPRALGWVKGKDALKTEALRAEQRKIASGASRVARDDEPEAAAKSGSGGWIIQIGASDDPGRARNLLSKAKLRNRRLASLRGFTEKVRTNDGAVYRVRFAGLEQASAAQACRDLKQGGLPCIAVRD